MSSCSSTAVSQQAGAPHNMLGLWCTRRQVLSHSWELESVLQAAPKAKAATIQRLSRPRNTRSPTDACAYAGYKAAQLGKQRAAHEQRQREEAAYEAARQEALQGWLRAKEQVSLEDTPQHSRSAHVCMPDNTNRGRPVCCPAVACRNNGVQPSSISSSCRQQRRRHVSVQAQ